MKEKTYYEVLVEMEGKEYDRFKTETISRTLGAICAVLVEQLQNDKQLNEINYMIPIEK